MKQKKNIDWSLAKEKSYPFIVAALVGILYIILKPDIKDDTDTVLNVVIDVASILIGFLSALLALLLSLSNNTIVIEIFKRNHYKELMKEYFEASIGSGFVLIALTGILFIRRTIAEWSLGFIELIKFFWVVVTMFFFTSAYRVISVVLRIAFFDNETEKKEECMTEDEEQQYDEIKRRREMKRKER